MMHLVFERSNGRLKSNCNILALTWMPYYIETKFRQALLEYHQKQLISLTQPSSGRHRLAAAVQINQEEVSNGSGNSQGENVEQLERRLSARGSPISNQAIAAAVQLVTRDQFLNSRLAELYQRYAYTKLEPTKPTNEDEFGRVKLANNSSQLLSGEEITRELDAKYGRMPEFGWLVVGNVGKIVGVTLTSTLPAPVEIDGRQGSTECNQRDSRTEQDRNLIVFNDDCETPQESHSSPSLANNARDHQSTLPNGDFGSAQFDLFRPDKKCKRRNYNLRGHLDEIILVRWNELYQKLATVDSKGNVLIWCKINEKFTIQTPFYNRTKSVADFKWSNDGKTALICYTDSFILVGSSSGQRHWHSMLNLDEYHITCASWTPNDEQLLLGVSNGNVVIIDLPQSELTELVVNHQVNIRTICWSTYDMNLSHLAEVPKYDAAKCNQIPPRRRKRNSALSAMGLSLSTSPSSSSSSSLRQQSFQSAIVNQRRLSRDCSIFSRYRFCSQGPRAAPTMPITPLTEAQSDEAPIKSTHTKQANILAIEFANSTIKLYEGGLEDPNPILVNINLESFILAWSLSGKILAVAGFNIHTSAPSIGCLKCRYANVIKFFNQQGRLTYEHKLRYSRYPVTALTWAHDDQRIFLATGPRLHCARVFTNLPSLCQLVSAKLHSRIQLASKKDVLETLASGKYANSLLNWQSFNCPIDFRKQSQNLLASASAGANHDSSRSSSLTDSSRLSDMNETNLKHLSNVNVLKLKLPTNLKLKVDKLFEPTIKQPLDEQLTLSDIVWHVPKNRQRYYCTMICYTSDLDHSDIGSIYRHEINDIQSDFHGATDHYKVFVLYIEVQGSLVPILKARRIGQLKPEFVIYDPENQLHLGRKVHGQLNHKVSDVTLDSPDLRKTRRLDCEKVSAPGAKPKRNLLDNCADLHESPASGLLHSDFRQLKTRGNLLSQNSAGVEPEELVRVRSNVWGTKFKIVNAANRMIRRRAILGSVVYKASILHLQPRQIFLTMRDMSNYCVLCSSHHHEPPRFGRGADRTSGVQSKICDHSVAGAISLVDSPNTHVLSVPSQRQGKRSAKQHLSNKEKVFMSVGDNLRVAPKLEPNQRYLQYSPKQMGASLRPTDYSPRTKTIQTHGDPRPSTSRAALEQDRPRDTRQPRYRRRAQQLSEGSRTRRLELSGSSSATRNVLNDDILTLSLGQGDQVRVEMSSLESASNVPDDNKMDEFLESNKTLKSIQTITKMIIDLSSRVDVDEQSGRNQVNSALVDHELSTLESPPASPEKIIKLSSGHHHHGRPSPASHKYKTPETPIHRPRRRMARVDRSQSAHSTPFLDYPLPAPPPSVPIGRRLTSSAKRFLDGSLRSLYGSADNSGYLSTCDDLEPEECEPLVSGRTNRQRLISASTALGQRSHQFALSQPCTPVRHQSGSTTPSMGWFGNNFNQLNKQSIDLGSLKDHLLKKVRKSTADNWRKFAANNGDEDRSRTSVGFTRARSNLTDESTNRKRLTKFRDTQPGGRSLSRDRNVLTRNSAGSLQPDDATSIASDATIGLGSSTDFSDAESHGADGSSDSDSDCLERPKRASSTGQSMSVKNLTELDRFNLLNVGDKLRKAKQGGSIFSNRRRLTGERKKSICNNANCCCAREFKLNNRPPVWNEFSQVYQLDFGGRVTQESAKNLQIDYDGSLALQFGRIDRCTYTLDYKYPFNAVQAMAIALASLTQRMK